MQIYFLGSISALRKMGSSYLKIIDALEALHHQVWCEHIIKRVPNKKGDYPVTKNTDYYKVTVNRIKYADAMFAEISYPTANVGYEIAYALGISLPVYAFYRSDIDIPTMFLGSDDKNFHLVPYTEDDLVHLVEQNVSNLEENAKDQIVLPLSPFIKKYLNWIAKKRSVSKSTFIRSLIEAKMLKDKEYKKEYI